MKLIELFTGPEKWTKGASARDAKGGRLVGVDHPRAASWCLVGGGLRCYLNEAAAGRTLLYNKLSAAARELYPILASDGLVSFNDHPGTTFEHIRAVVEKAGI